jgi:lysozyme family protein
VTITNTTNELIQVILDNEVGGRPSGGYTNDPLDAGGRTQYGIAERSNPEAWADGEVTLDEARVIYTERYIKPFMGINDAALLHQVVDFGVTSGPATAIRILQQLTNQTVDGTLGPKTLVALANYPAGTLFGSPISSSTRLNLAFRDARLLFYAGITKRTPSNLRFLLGWLKRALEFS